MSRATRAQAMVRAAAYGSGGLVGLGSAFFALLLGEALLARRSIGAALEAPLDADGRYLPRRPDATLLSNAEQGAPLRLAVLGDSGAAGFGVARAEQTTGALLASGLAAGSMRPVELRSFAVVGARSSDLDTQVAAALAWRPDAVAMLIGANDVTHAVTPGRSVALLSRAVRQLRAAGCVVVVGTCPDLGTVRPIQHPLRWVARQWSRSLAAAQIVAVVEADGRAVALADLLGAGFDAHPEIYFGEDRFHPSAEGYRAVAEVMVPSLLDALRRRPDEVSSARVTRTPGRPRGRGAVLELTQAAARASDVAGAEISEGPRPRDGRGVRGATLRLRRRIRGPAQATREPTTEGSPADGPTSQP